MNLKRTSAAALVAGLSATAIAISIIPTHVDNTPVTVVVDAKKDLSINDQRELQLNTGGTVKKSISPSQVVLATTKGNLDRVRAKARKFSRAATVEIDAPAHLEAIPNDPCVTGCKPDYNGQPRPEKQWALEAINAPQAWDQTTGSSSVLVAVVDDGVNGSIPELAGKVVREIDEIPGSPRGGDHGTEVASIIAANTNNGIGIAGISWKSRILSVRVADANGNLTTSDEAKGIRDAADAGASVINVSIGGIDESVLADAVNYASSKGALVVAGANNSYTTAKLYPAGYSNVLSVSAVDENHYNSMFGYGSWINVYAPGQEVIAIDSHGSPTVVTGTSFSTPMASGAAALIKAKFPNALPEGIQAMIRTNARRVIGTGRNGIIPLLDVNASLTAHGYWVAASDGLVRNEGSAPRLGFPKTLTKPIVGMAPTTTNKGYWLVASDGGIFTFGDAKFYGSTGAIHLNKPIVGMAATQSGKGYWLVASDGGIFTFGDAKFYGSTGAIHLNKPIVGMAATRSGKGYWLVASDGGIFTFGDAKFYGSTGAIHLNKPIVGISVTAGGGGYWLVGADGKVFPFGGAKAYGSANSTTLTSPVTSMTITPNGTGYWLLTASGRVLPFGDAKQWGQNLIPTNRQYIGIAPAL